MAPKKSVSPPPRPTAIPSDPTKEGEFLVKRPPTSTQRAIPQKPPRLANLAESRRALEESKRRLEANKARISGRTTNSPFLVTRIRTFATDPGGTNQSLRNFSREGRIFLRLGIFRRRDQATQRARDRNLRFGESESDFIIVNEFGVGFQVFVSVPRGVDLRAI